MERLAELVSVVAPAVIAWWILVLPPRPEEDDAEELPTPDYWELEPPQRWPLS